MTSLLPPLGVIADNLFGPSDDVIQRWADGDLTLSPETVAKLESDERAKTRKDAWSEPVPDEVEEGPVSEEPFEMPAFLEEMIDQRIAAQQLPQDKPKAGQILRVEEVVGPDGVVVWVFSHPLAVLLDRPTEKSEVWHSWVVSHEVDYATEWDVLLEDSDQPCDPLARMVQVWNRLEVYIPSTTAVLAQLSAERLEAIGRLTAEYRQGEESDRAPAAPGSVMDRYLAGTFRLLTGTPLGDDKDPRRTYQQLYHQAAAKIGEAAKLALVRPGLLDQLIAQLIEAANRLGETLIPRPLVPQALGEEGTQPQLYELEGLARLQVFPPPGDDSVQIRVELTGDQPMNARVSAGEHVLQSEDLSPEHPRADFFLTLDTHSLHLTDQTGTDRLHWTPQAPK